MKKINNKGFALVETLIVTAFVVGIFSVMYANFYPMMGEYEKRENYDDISSIYKANLFKKLIEEYVKKQTEKSKELPDIIKKNNNTYQNCKEVDLPPDPYDPRPHKTTVCEPVTNDYTQIEIDKSLFSNLNDDKIYRDYYEILVNNLDVEKIYLLPYNISEFKNKVRIRNGTISDIDVQTKEYIDYLPEFSQNKYRLKCRIIVKFKAGENKESSENNSGEYKFATIGVNC